VTLCHDPLCYFRPIPSNRNTTTLPTPTCLVPREGPLAENIAILLAAGADPNGILLDWCASYGAEIPSTIDTAPSNVHREPQ